MGDMRSSGMEMDLNDVAYEFGQNLPKLEHYVGRASLVLVLVVALVAGLVLAARWFRTNSNQLAQRVLYLPATDRQFGSSTTLPVAPSARVGVRHATFRAGRVPGPPPHHRPLD